MTESRAVMDWATIMDWFEKWRPAEGTPSRLRMGTTAYKALRALCASEQPETLPARAHYGRLVLSGLPIHVDEDWPPNLWAVLDDRGDAVRVGILPEATS